jgi:hypothetical protein
MVRKLFLFAVMFFNCLSVDAGIIVNVVGTSIAADGVGYVDVRISSDNNDALTSFGYMFQITQLTGSNPGDLTFRQNWDSLDPLNTANQSNSEQYAADYVLGSDTDPGFFSASLLSPTLLIGGDSAYSGADTAPLTGDYLLARLELQHLTPNAALAVGSTFQVSLVSNPAFTSFYDNAGLFSMPDPITLSYISTPGTVTISSSPVPEPSSLLSLIAGGCSWVLVRSRRCVFWRS